MDLSEYLEMALNESQQFPAEYKKDYAANHSVMQIPQILDVPLGTTLYNPEEKEETGKRHPYNRYAWIRYWQAFTGNYKNRLQCTCCGEDIFVDTDSYDCKQYFINHKYDPAKGGTTDDIKAIGGHFHRNFENKEDGYMIVPICRSCNAQTSDKPLKVLVRNPFVEEKAEIFDK